MKTDNAKMLYYYLVCLVFLLIMVGSFSSILNSGLDLIMEPEQFYSIYDFDNYVENHPEAAELGRAEMLSMMQEDNWNVRDNGRWALRTIINSSILFIVSLLVFSYHWKSVNKIELQEQSQATIGRMSTRSVYLYVVALIMLVWAVVHLTSFVNAVVENTIPIDNYSNIEMQKMDSETWKDERNLGGWAVEDFEHQVDMELSGVASRDSINNRNNMIFNGTMAILLACLYRYHWNLAKENNMKNKE